MSKKRKIKNLKHFRQAFVPRWATPGYSTPVGPPPVAMAGVVATAAPAMAGYLTPSGPLAQCHAPEREVGPPQGQVGNDFGRRHDVI